MQKQWPQSLEKKVEAIEIAVEFNDLFPSYSGTSTYIAEALNNGIIKREETVLDLPKSLQLSLTVFIIKRHEGSRHRFLKQFAYNMLKDLGEKTPLIEHHYADIYAPNLKLVIECGRTNLYSLWCFFRSNDKEFWLLSYDCWPKLKLVKYLRTVKTSEFVSRIDREAIKKIADILE